MKLDHFARVTVALQLVNSSRASVDPNGTNGAAVPPADDTNRLTGRHWMENIVDDNGKKVQSACRVCYAKSQGSGTRHTELKNKRKTTMQRCKTYKVPLCSVPCMEIYHTVNDYSQN